jgi:phospholipid/cholesterol/gamma-HCH transport system substrate-binding protein
MDRDANYVTVGVFVLLLLAMAAGFVLWYSETGDRRSYQRYEIYFDGSVFGLSEGGSVRYLGVAVGRVARIGLDPRDASRVRILADIAEDTPIDQTTVARLALQGVTGLLFIDLKPADPTKPKSLTPPGLAYPVIPSERSDFDVFVSTLPDVVAKASEVLNRMSAMLSDRNIQAVSRSIGNFETASAELPGAMKEVRQLVARLETTTAEIHGVAVEVRGVTAVAAPEQAPGMKKLRDAAESMASASQRLDAMVAQNEDNVSRFTEHGLAEFEALARDLRESAQSIERLGQSLQEDPSRLLYQPANRGVEIPQ